MFSDKLPRNVGLLLLAAQVTNIYMSLPAVDGRWSFFLFLKAFFALPMMNLMTWTFTIGLAITMIRHNRFYLRLVMATIGCYIFLNLIDFGHRAEVSGFFVAMAVLVANCAFFIFVLKYYIHIKKQPLIELEAVGPWARLTKVTPEFVHVYKIKDPPADIESRLLELEVDDLIVKLRFELCHGSEYVFRRV